MDYDQSFKSLNSAGFANVSTRWVASDDALVGFAIRQRPAPDSEVALTTEIAVDFSMGGPAVAFDQLPTEARAHAQTLAGYDKTEPVLVSTTKSGIAYKTDAHLFGPCEAVNAAYRTYVDPAYGDSCY